MSETITRIKLISKKIDMINHIIQNCNNKISVALEDETIHRPAILMHLVSIAEQINKLKNDSAFQILEKFSKDDLKGIYDVRNFIAHDYEGINLPIIEFIIRERLPILKSTIEDILNKTT
jgi:uncharacterized protein with HEPN domain